MQRATVAWCTRAGRFGWVGANQLAFNGGMVLLQILLARGAADSGLGLMVGNVFALLLSTAALVVVVRHDSRGRLFSGWSGRRMATQARRYRNFPTYMVLYGLASTVRERLLHFMLGYFAGAAFLGRFAMAGRLVGAPNSLAYSAVSPVFYAYASRATPGSTARLAGALIEVSVVAMLPPFVFAMVEAEVLARTVLGPQWVGTGEFIRLLAMPMLVLAVTCWLDRLFDVRQRQRVALALEGGFTILSVALAALLLAAGHAAAAVIVFAVTSTLYYAIYALLAFAANDLPVIGLRRPAILAAVMLAASLLASAIVAPIESPWVRLAVCGLFWLIAVAAHSLRPTGRETLRVLFGRGSSR
jgi:O-antigen/teichoic acid export membrane protein